VPALGALFQDLVVSLLVLLDETFEADVAPSFDSAVVAGEQKEEPRHATVAVPEWVDTQEIEIQGGGEYLLSPGLFDAGIPRLFGTGQ